MSPASQPARTQLVPVSTGGARLAMIDIIAIATTTTTATTTGRGWVSVRA
jgi:hypothetical protein